MLKFRAVVSELAKEVQRLLFGRTLYIVLEDC